MAECNAGAGEFLLLLKLNNAGREMRVSAAVQRNDRIRRQLIARLRMTTCGRAASVPWHRPDRAGRANRAYGSVLPSEKPSSFGWSSGKEMPRPSP